MLDVAAQHAPLIDRLTDKAADVIRSGRYILGPEVRSSARWPSTSGPTTQSAFRVGRTR